MSFTQQLHKHVNPRFLVLATLIDRAQIDIPKGSILFAPTDEVFTWAFSQGELGMGSLLSFARLFSLINLHITSKLGNKVKMFQGKTFNYTSEKIDKVWILPGEFTIQGVRVIPIDGILMLQSILNSYKNQQAKGQFYKITKESQFQILKNLDYKSVINFCSTNKSFRQFCKNKEFQIWHYLLKRDGYENMKAYSPNHPDPKWLYKRFVEIQAFFERHLDKVDWNSLSENPALSEAFFEKHLDEVDWGRLSGNPSLSEAFFEKHLKKFDWGRLSQNPALSEAFFEKHLGKVDWWRLSINSGLSEAFFKKYLDKVNWYWLSQNPALSEAFFEKYLNKINWVRLSLNPSLSEAFFEKHLDKVDWGNLSQNPGPSEAFFERHLKKVKWVELSRNPSLSEAFFEKYLNKVNWYWLSGNPSLSEAFFEKHLKKVKWWMLLINPGLSETFFEKHLDEVDWERISVNPLMII